MLEEITTSSLADTWRWWGSMGAGLAIYLIRRWAKGFRDGQTPLFPAGWRKALAYLCICALSAILIAGAIIPLANGSRLALFNSESPLFLGGMAVAWLLWGVFAWGMALAFAESRRAMLAVCVFWWWAMAFALDATKGMML